jgi:2-(1,2-epoxy-1,2-dihydrophenyl)acetyl-CoA isomerase
MMTGEIVDAKTAMEMGMITRVVPDAELMPQAMQLAKKLSRGPTAAIGRVKELLEASAIKDYPAQLELEREAQIQSGLTKDAAEGIAAFIEKRSPDFTGE